METVQVLPTLRPPLDAIQTRLQTEEDAAVVVDEGVGAERRRRRVAEDVEATREGTGVVRRAIRGLGADEAIMRREG